MENNEIMNYEELDAMDVTVDAGEKTGMSTGVAMLIGAGVTLAIGAGVKLVKKGIAYVKAQKELKKAEQHDFVDFEPEDNDHVVTK